MKLITIFLLFLISIYFVSAIKIIKNEKTKIYVNSDPKQLRFNYDGDNQVVVQPESCDQGVCVFDLKEYTKKWFDRALFFDFANQTYEVLVRYPLVDIDTIPSPATNGGKINFNALFLMYNAQISKIKYIDFFGGLRLDWPDVDYDTGDHTKVSLVFPPGIGEFTICTLDDKYYKSSYAQPLIKSVAISNENNKKVTLVGSNFYTNIDFIRVSINDDMISQDAIESVSYKNIVFTSPILLSAGDNISLEVGTFMTNFTMI
ncbi:hypothetical protein CYY_002083 [Polysphondylium violaceum]|uniref:IPT/TIG domain-containing protein n=1 Tax=Polysphondylium violaceum TaxID=133409 RepID=A0A8J4Q0R5_9MYCE|nr:hypothetical protein CYY_002083 [Polysphondylium violaceum]